MSGILPFVELLADMESMASGRIFLLRYGCIGLIWYA